MGLFNPKNADDSTGLWPNDDRAKIIDAKCVMNDYNGTKPPSPAIMLTLTGEGVEKPVTNYYGVGKTEEWKPSLDGKTMIPIGKRRQMHVSTNAIMLYKSLAVAGVPDEIIDADDVTALIGIDAHWVRTKVKREGLEDKNLKEGEKQKPFEVCVVTQIYALPGEAGGAGPSAAVAVAGGLADKAKEAVLRYVEAAGKKGVKKSDLPMLVIQDATLAADPDRNEVMSLLVKDDSFLAAGPWTFASGVIKAAV
jgi:hypothetical protein